MTWFGTVSAWAAVVVGLAFGALAVLQVAWGLVPWGLGIIAVTLLIGAFRTLRRMSGGLRLLAGAWGLGAGSLLVPFIATSLDVSAGSYSVSAVAAPILVLVSIGLPVVCLAGLALTVLHKEQK